MRYFIVAGEKSGDLHGSLLVKYLLEGDPQAEIAGIGGDAMKKKGMQLFQHIKDMSFMGVVDVVAHIPKILKSIKAAKKSMVTYQPDVVIFIDYVEYNLKLAGFAKKKGFKTCFFISPQIWAWNTQRVYKIKKRIDKMFVILPFEKSFYEKYDMEVSYQGHPLIDQMDGFVAQERNVFLEKHQLPQKPIIALLPGTRNQELKHILPLLCSVVDEPLFSDYQFVLAAVNEVERVKYAPAIKKNIRLVYSDTYQLLHHSHAALVTSGTATLETALFELPQVVCYKTTPLNYRIFKYLAKVKYISLVNLINQKKTVTELIQNQLTTQNLVHELSSLLNQERREKMIEEYQSLRKKLGTPLVSKRIAEKIIQFTQ